MRPRTLDEVVGQEHLLGEGSALRTAIEQGRPHSMVLYGPPGSGKTTLARIVAAGANAAFEELSAVQAGKAEVRAVLDRAAERRQGRPRHDLLPRRDPPLQQGPAGRAAARGRGGARHADRGDDREPVLRGQLGAAVPGAGLRAAGADGRARRGRCCAGRSSAASAATRAVDDEAIEFLAARSGGDARTALAALELACETAATEPRHARGGRGRAAAPGRPLRQGRRPALRHDLGLDQGHARVGSRRLALLPGGDARGAARTRASSRGAW